MAIKAVGVCVCSSFFGEPNLT